MANHRFIVDAIIEDMWQEKFPPPMQWLKDNYIQRADYQWFLHTSESIYVHIKNDEIASLFILKFPVKKVP